MFTEKGVALILVNPFRIAYSYVSTLDFEDDLTITVPDQSNFGMTDFRDVKFFLIILAFMLV